MKEYKTVKYIREELDKMGLEYEAAIETATIVKIKAKAGVNYPPFHPFCRTTTIPYIKGERIKSRTARDYETNRNYSTTAKNYTEYEKEQEELKEK